MISQPLTAIESIITAAEFAAFVGTSETDPLISILSISATDSISRYLEMELIDRQRRMTSICWPTIGTDTSPSLSRATAEAETDIKLPYSHTATSLDSALSFGVTVTPDLLKDKPFIIRFNTFPNLSFDSGVLALDVTYTTGYGTIDDVPISIKMAALSLAAYMYEHRGECDASQALYKSGAASSIASYKTNLVVI